MNRAPAATASILLLLLFAWTFSGVLAGGDLFLRDTFRHYAPHKAAIAAAWAAGRLPEWNPDAFCGMPRAAVPAAGIWYPWNAVYLLVPNPGRATTLFILLHYPLAFAGMLVLARRAGLGTGGLVAAAAYALSGFALATHVNPHPVTAFAALPWLFAAAWRATPRGAAGTALVLGWIAAGGEAVVGWLAAVLAAGLLWADPAEASRPRRRAACAAGALGLGVAVSAAAWLPALAAVPFTDRADGLSGAASAYYSLDAFELFEMLLPYAYLNAEGRNPVGHLLFPYGAPLYLVLYMGAPVWFLALVGLGGRRRAARVGAVAFVAGLLLALGSSTPLHDLLRSLVPPLRAFRFPVKYLHVAALGLSLLAGAGAARLADPDPETGRDRRRAARALGAAYLLLAAVLLLPGGAAWRYVRATFLPSWLHAVAALGAGVLIGEAAALGATARRGGGAWAGAALAVLVALDGAAAARPQARTVPPSFYRDPPAVLARLGTGRVLGPDVPPPAYHLDRVEGDFEIAYAEWAKDLLFAQTGSLWGVRYFDGYEGFRASSFRPLLRAILSADPQNRDRLLGAYSVGAVVEPPFDVVRNPHRSPRAQTPLHVRYVASDAEALDAVRGGHVPTGTFPGEEVLVRDPARAGRRESFPGSTEVRLARDEAEAVDVEVEAGVARLLVLADADWPGWTAAVDGRPVPIRRANAYVRAVDVPAGRHTVSFRYRAPGLRAGIALSLVGLAAAGFLLLRRA